MVTVRARVGSSVWPSMCRSHVYGTACLVFVTSFVHKSNRISTGADRRQRRRLIVPLRPQ